MQEIYLFNNFKGTKGYRVKCLSLLWPTNPVVLIRYILYHYQLCVCGCRSLVIFHVMYRYLGKFTVVNIKWSQLLLFTKFLSKVIKISFIKE